jgi:hypothetical protein
MDLCCVHAWIQICNSDSRANARNPAGPLLTLRSKSTGQLVSVAFVDERGKTVKQPDIKMVVGLDAARDTKK